jgi:uncharacterized protein (TIGR00730 family)
MSFRPSRYRTGDPELDRLVLELLEATGAEEDRDQLHEILVSGVRLAGDATDRLDLKIVNAALKEMRAAFKAFAPYEHIPKVTIFGSARTQAADPLYAQTRELARVLAEQGWMVVTGAGPGIMQAGMEGAGREHSFGVSIRLPFESGANEVIAGDTKLVSMKYFFTRKLMLMKESSAFVCLPGGFGTMDETFELLTLQQTGKSEPAPIVLMECKGDTYWRAWQRFVDDELVGRGLINAEDLNLVMITDSPEAAADEVLGFYRNYHSIRWVGDRLVIRLRGEPTDDELEQLNSRFGDVCTQGRIERVAPFPPEVTDQDHLELPRVAMHFNQWRIGRLNGLVRAINSLASAPDLPAMATERVDPTA